MPFDSQRRVMMNVLLRALHWIGKDFNFFSFSKGDRSLYIKEGYP